MDNLGLTPTSPDQTLENTQAEGRRPSANGSSQERRYVGHERISIRRDVLIVSITIVLIGAGYLGYREYQWYSLRQHIAGMVAQMSRGLSGNNSDTNRFCRINPESWLCDFVTWR